VPVGGSIGTLVGAKPPDLMRRLATQAIGIVTLLVGVSNLLVFDTMSKQVLLTLTLVAVQ
jgi:uncharacterized membrane protein YqgA involved in biofilm formation